MDLHVEHEVVGRLIHPLVDRRAIGHRVEARVELDGLESLRVPGQAVARRELRRIPLLHEARIGPARGSNEDSSAHVGSQYRGLMGQPELAWKLDRISPRAYQHPADRAATAALAKVPYLDEVVRKLVALGYERALCRALMVIAAGEAAEDLSLDAFIAQGMDYSERGTGLERLTRLLQQMKVTHPMPVRRVRLLLDWVREGDYDRMARGDYLRRGEEPSAREEADSASVFYGERIAGAFQAAGSSIGDVGQQL